MLVMKQNILKTLKCINLRLAVISSLTLILICGNIYSQEKSGVIEPEIKNNIISLDIELNSSGMLPPEIFSRTSLEELKINGNSDYMLPSDVKNLYSLRVLDLGNAQINELPEELAQLRLLMEIHLNYELWQYRLDEVQRITRAKIILE